MSKPPKKLGVDAVAEMMNLLDSEHRDRLLKQMAEKDPSLTEKVRKQMFTFEDLLKINDVGMQLLIRQTPEARLVVAMRKVSDELREFVLKNVSPRARKTLEEEIESQGPRLKSEIDLAQAEILKSALAMLSEGKLEFANPAANTSKS